MTVVTESRQCVEADLRPITKTGRLLFLVNTCVLSSVEFTFTNTGKIAFAHVINASEFVSFHDRSHHKREHTPSPSKDGSKKLRDSAEDLVLREDISKHTRRKRMMLCERFADSDQEAFEPEENITIGL